jgi:hypothetical protein
VAVAIGEELAFSSTHSRMGYFKVALDFDGKVRVKKKQLAGNVGFSNLLRNKLNSPSPDTILTLRTSTPTSSPTSKSKSKSKSSENGKEKRQESEQKEETKDGQGNKKRQK